MFAAARSFRSMVASLSPVLRLPSFCSSVLLSFSPAVLLPFCASAYVPSAGMKSSARMCRAAHVWLPSAYVPCHPCLVASLKFPSAVLLSWPPRKKGPVSSLSAQLPRNYKCLSSGGNNRGFIIASKYYKAEMCPTSLYFCFIIFLLYISRFRAGPGAYVPPMFGCLAEISRQDH